MTQAMQRHVHPDGLAFSDPMHTYAVYGTPHVGWLIDVRLTRLSDVWLLPLDLEEIPFPSYSCLAKMSGSLVPELV